MFNTIFGGLILLGGICFELLIISMAVFIFKMLIEEWSMDGFIERFIKTLLTVLFSLAIIILHMVVYAQLTHHKF